MITESECWDFKFEHCDTIYSHYYLCPNILEDRISLQEDGDSTDVIISSLLETLIFTHCYLCTKCPKSSFLNEGGDSIDEILKALARLGQIATAAAQWQAYVGSLKVRCDIACSNATLMSMRLLIS